MTMLQTANVVYQWKSEKTLLLKQSFITKRKDGVSHKLLCKKIKTNNKRKQFKLESWADECPVKWDR